MCSEISKIDFEKSFEIIYIKSDWAYFLLIKWTDSKWQKLNTASDNKKQMFCEILKT